MSDTLATLIDKIQVLLGDASGTNFTDALVTAGIRVALDEWNMSAPVYAAQLITGVNDQYEYELTDVDASACNIFDVLIQGDGANELDVSLDHDTYLEDERVFFRLRQPVTTSDQIIVRYTLYHTINGLDSATESTLLSRDDHAIVAGGAYNALMARAAGTVESNNLDRNQVSVYMRVAQGHRAAFMQRLAYAMRTRKTPVSEPDTRSWNDAYHSWDQ